MSRFTPLNRSRAATEKLAGTFPIDHARVLVVMSPMSWAMATPVMIASLAH
jgi:hypothetical protein